MTREKLVGLINASGFAVTVDDNVVGRILAALDKERDGEMVLGIGHVDWFANSFGGGTYGIDEIRHPLEKVNGQAGTLIFRPTNQEQTNGK